MTAEQFATQEWNIMTADLARSVPNLDQPAMQELVRYFRSRFDDWLKKRGKSEVLVCPTCGDNKWKDTELDEGILTVQCACGSVYRLEHGEA